MTPLLECQSLSKPKGHMGNGGLTTLAFAEVIFQLIKAAEKPNGFLKYGAIIISSKNGNYKSLVR